MATSSFLNQHQSKKSLMEKIKKINQKTLKIDLTKNKEEIKEFKEVLLKEAKDWEERQEHLRGFVDIF